MKAEKLCVLIPSLEPDERLPKYVDSLLDAGFGGIVVVNDGSDASYDGIFDAIKAKERCFVLRHEVNKGKGQGLRTGIEYIRNHTDFEGVITADADGQHTAHDTLLLADAMENGRQELLLGSRDFSSKNKNVPPRSRFGNRTTSAVFALFYGHWLPDTQTGLRAVTRANFDDLLKITGDRFEYEMNMLIYCAQNKIPFKIIPIETIYLEENKSSHFHAFRDSWRIYKLLLGSFFRFSAVSILSSVIDYAVLMLMMFLAFDGMPDVVICGIPFSAEALYATPIARLCSAPVNYILNMRYAFKKKKAPGSLWRYIVLSVLVLAATTFIYGFLNHFITSKAVSVLLKIVIDVIMYIVNFDIQRSWVFGEKKAE